MAFRKSDWRAFLAACLLQMYWLLGDGQCFTSPVIITKSGCVRGKLVELPDNNHVSAFLGIPFGESTAGKNRFRNPVPAKKWDGIYDATAKPSPCMQYIRPGSEFFSWVPKTKPSEDCLYLNVWAPDTSSDTKQTKLPVLVWIYGGGYYHGSTDLDTYDGSALAATGNVIVASMNYRVGVFGFLQAHPEEAPGNMGMYDQNLALKWIKDNIEAFGGDSNSITLFGESAGATSVGLHMLSPLSKDLFNRAILQSGAPYHPLLGIPPKLANLQGGALAAAVGCTNDTSNLVSDPECVFECLRNKDAEELAKVDSAGLEKAPLTFIPGYGNDFMPKSPIEVVESGDFKKTEVLIGLVENEGSLFLPVLIPEIFNIQTATPVNMSMGRVLISTLFPDSTHPRPDVIADFYLSDIQPDESSRIVEAVYDAFGDNIIVCPTNIFAEKVKGDVFFYLFTHKSSNSPLGEWLGTAHFDDVPFVFGQPIRHPESYTDEERELSKSLIQRWANFARLGTPVLDKSGEEWPKYTASDPQYVELNAKKQSVGSGIHTEACNFWRNYYTTNP